MGNKSSRVIPELDTCQKHQKTESEAQTENNQIYQDMDACFLQVSSLFDKVFLESQARDGIKCCEGRD